VEPHLETTLGEYIVFFDLFLVSSSSV